jgi:EamA-like transporter family
VFTAISQGVPAGISALIVGLQPIVTSTLASRFMGEKVTRLQWIGLALGLVGVLLVLHDRSNFAGGLRPWLGCKLLVVDRPYARHALPEALLRGYRLARRHSHSIHRRGSAVYAWRFAFETREIHWTGGLIFAMAWLHRSRWIVVLAHSPLCGDRLRQSVLSGAGRDRLLRLHPFR